MSWSLQIMPALAALFLWWGLTGLIAWLVGKPTGTYRLLMLGASVVALLSLVTITQVTAVATSTGAWLGFIGALGLWSWIETSFLTGWITGPRKTLRPGGATGWLHAFDAVAAILWHELAIILVVGLVALISIGAPNQIALYTLLLLWVMRSSAKLNLFLGVRNLGEVFLPKHLAHLVGYLRQRTMNLLFPFSIALASVLAWQLGVRALSAELPFEAVGYSLLAMLAALALFEHWLMVLPIPADLLWRWSLANRRGTQHDWSGNR